MSSPLHEHAHCQGSQESERRLIKHTRTHSAFKKINRCMAAEDNSGRTSHAGLIISSHVSQEIIFNQQLMTIIMKNATKMARISEPRC